MPLNILWWKEKLNEKKISKEMKWKSFDSEKYSNSLTWLQKEIDENKKSQSETVKELKNLLNDTGNNKKEGVENFINVEKTRLDKLHEAILKLDISDKTNKRYKTLEDILNANNKSTQDKLELMVKIIHSMDGEIDVKYEDNTIEHIPFKCWNRALFFNYLFNNHNDKLHIDKSNICLPYGHCMNVIEMWWQTYLVDGWAWCFNKIEYTTEQKWSWKCIKLKQPVETYKGSKNFYPFSSFPYTEKLNKNDLELYTSFNLQGYSHYFTDKLYKAAQKHYHDESIKDKTWLQKFFDEYLSKQNNPLEEILDKGDPLAIDSRDNQIAILKKQIEKSLSYDKNKEKFDNINKYMKTITEDSHDLRAEEREWENGPLTQFHKADKESMDAMKIPGEMIPKIKEALAKKVWKTNNIKKISRYIIRKFRKYKLNWKEKLLDDPELDSIVKNFINAIDKKASQLNKDLKDYLPTYLSGLFKA